MSQQTDYKFHVIELLEPPYSDPERYVCIPNSWLRLRETADGVAIVKFPIEELSEIKKRVEKEEFSDSWTVFLADVKYSTNTYKDAIDHVKILNKISVQEQNSTEIVENIPSTSDKMAVHTPSTQSSDAEPVNRATTEQLDFTDNKVEICQEKVKVGIVDSSPKPRRYLTRQTLRMPASVNNSVVLLDQTARDNGPGTSNCVEESNKSDNTHNQENESSLKNPPELTRKLEIHKALRSVLGDDFKNVLKQLHNEYERNHLILEKLRLAFVSNCKIIEEMIELTDEVINSPDITNLGATVEELGNNMMKVDINKNNSDEVNVSKLQNDAQKEKNTKQNSDGTEVKNNNPLNKIRGQARKFTLPPEYDPNDSRWTLKHREKKKGLVELLPHSRVYVDAIKLGHCKRMSKDSKTLARMLLLEIFSENALSICSLTGKKANAFDLEGTSVRPGLDAHARTVLLNFVEKHANEKKWVKFNTHLISNTIRNKIQEFRGKYTKRNL